MALSIDYTFNGVQISSAYIKVERVIANKLTALAEVSVAANSNQAPVFQRAYSFDVDLNGPNLIKQAYLYLKTLPEFADAVDC